MIATHIGGAELLNAIYTEDDLYKKEEKTTSEKKGVPDMQKSIAMGHRLMLDGYRHTSV